MQTGKEKKLTVFTKNLQSKKPALEIETDNNQDINSKMASTHPLPSHAEEVKPINALTSPSNFKISQQAVHLEPHEADPASKKPQQQPMQKKPSLKDPPTTQIPKIEQISKPAALNGFVSPKAALKDKVLISYASEKNISIGVKTEKKESQRDSKVKIEELEKII